MQQQFALDFTQTIPPATQERIAAGMRLIYSDRVKRSERPEKHGNRQNIWASAVFQR